MSGAKGRRLGQVTLSVGGHLHAQLEVLLRDNVINHHRALMGFQIAFLRHSPFCRLRSADVAIDCEADQSHHAVSTPDCIASKCSPARCAGPAP